MRGEAGRLRCLTGGYYWFPIPGDGLLSWEVLSCHELGHDAEVGHIDLWPSVIDRVAEVWRKHTLHGKDAPFSDWLARVIRRFDLDRRSVRVVYDEHERMLPSDRRLVEGTPGLRPRRAGRVLSRGSSPLKGGDHP